MDDNTIRVKVDSLRNHLDRHPDRSQELAIYFYQAYLKLSTEIKTTDDNLSRQFCTLNYQKFDFN